MLPNYFTLAIERFLARVFRPKIILHCFCGCGEKKQPLKKLSSEPFTKTRGSLFPHTKKAHTYFFARQIYKLNIGGYI